MIGCWPRNKLGYSKNVEKRSRTIRSNFSYKTAITITGIMGFIYCVTFPSGKKYIGQTVQCIETRMSQHKRSKQDTLVSRAFKKYSSYQVEVLLQVNVNLLDTYEIKFIQAFNTIKPYGYNLASGGSSGRTHSESSRRKMSDSHKGVPLSELHKKRLSESHIGRIFSDESKLKISESKRGKQRPKEFKEKMSKLNRKDNHNLPSYVYKLKHGYRVRIGKKDVYFTDSTLNDEELLNEAIKCRDVYHEKLSND